MSAGLYCLENARTQQQRADMLALESAGTCLLCPEGMDADPQQLVVHRTRHWSVTPNEYPYRGTALHLLLVPHEHVGDVLDLSASSQQDFWAALAWVRAQYGLVHYGLGLRNGDCRFTGGTIAHLHVHLVVGDVDDPAHEPVRMKLSSRPARP